MTLKTKAQIEITPQQICDLFTTAVEGGSTYWCVKMRFQNTHGSNLSYQDVKTFEGRDWCVEVWDEDEEPHTIILDDFLRAFKARPFDLDDYDAEDADCLVQQAAFGDIVYG